MKERLQELIEALKANPNDNQKRRELAFFLIDNDAHEEALKQLNYLINLFPDDDILHYKIGLCYEGLKMLDAAETSYKKALSSAPNDPDYNYNLASVYDKKGDIEKAIQFYQITLQLDPNDCNAHFSLALQLIKKERPYEAIDELTTTLQLNPKDVYAYFYLAHEQHKQGEVELAIQNYQKVIDLSPDYSWAYYNLGCIAMDKQDYGAAKNYFEKTIKTNPTDIPACRALASLYLKEGQDQKALQLIKSSLAENGHHGDLYFTAAQIYKKLGSKEHVISSLEKSLQYVKTLTIPMEPIKQKLQELRDAK